MRRLVAAAATSAVAIVAIVALDGVGEPPVEPTVGSWGTGFEADAFAAVDQHQANAGTLEIAADVAHDGAASLRATVGGGVANAYARVVRFGTWTVGHELTYSIAVRLPPGFIKRMRVQHDLARLDNFPDDRDNAERTGVTLTTAGRIRLVRQKFDVEQVWLTGGVPLEEGRWHVIQVRQRLSSKDGEAENELSLDAEVVARSRRANSYGNPYRRIRFGLVAVGRAQLEPQTLWFDDVRLEVRSVSR